MAPGNANSYLVGTTLLCQITRLLVVRPEPFAALEIMIFHYVYCMIQISDTLCTGNLDVYRLSHSHEIYLLQSKTNYVLIYVLFVFRLVHVYRAL